MARTASLVLLLSGAVLLLVLLLATPVLGEQRPPVPKYIQLQPAAGVGETGAYAQVGTWRSLVAAVGF